MKIFKKKETRISVDFYAKFDDEECGNTEL
jgi:hypothetical protein